MNGPHVDILQLAQLKLSDDKLDQLWSNNNPRDLLLECNCIEELENEEFDEIPNYTDRYFDYHADSKQTLTNELRQVILDTLDIDCDDSGICPICYYVNEFGAGNHCKHYLGCLVGNDLFSTSEIYSSFVETRENITQLHDVDQNKLRKFEKRYSSSANEKLRNLIMLSANTKLSDFNVLVQANCVIKGERLESDNSMLSEVFRPTYCNNRSLLQKLIDL